MVYSANSSFRHENNKNRKSYLDFYVDEQLKKWARWSAKILTFGIGYPSKSIEGRLIDGGGLIIKSTTKCHTLNNPACEEIEELMNELNHYQPQLATAIRIRYTSNNIETQLKDMKLSKTVYKTNLKAGKTWFAAMLNKNVKSIG